MEALGFITITEYNHLTSMIELYEIDGYDIEWFIENAKLPVSEVKRFYKWYVDDSVGSSAKADISNVIKYNEFYKMLSGARRYVLNEALNGI